MSFKEFKQGFSKIPFKEKFELVVVFFFVYLTTFVFLILSICFLVKVIFL